ncbi:MAG: IS1 family transposase [Elusimicrobia bacterium]|nr:IS1 family transposase [Elusimicrobiota bacterium]
MRLMTSTGSDVPLLKRLQAARWRAGLRCPRCASPRCGVFMREDASGRRKLRCLACGRVFNDLTGTPMARSHLPLTAWHRAARLMLDGEPSCADLARRLGVKISTAWRLRRALRAVLADPVLRPVFMEAL